MPGFTSHDDFIKQVTVNNRFFRADWNKLFNPTAAAVAGEWHSLFRGAGSPPADALLNTGTALAFQSISFGTTNATGLYSGGDVGSTWSSIAWTRSGTTVTVSATAHGLSVGDAINVTVSSDTSAIPFNLYLVTAVTDANTFTFTGVNTAGTSGTISYVPPAFKTVINASAFSASSTTMPAVAMLVDLLAFYRVTAVTTTTAQSTTGSTGTGPYLPRYSNGKGVQAIMLNTNATPLGAGTPNLSIGYTNQDGTQSRATPAVLPIGKTAASNSHILYSGTGAGKYNPFMPLQAGDYGIRSIQSITNSTSYVSGEYSVVLLKPIFSLPMTTLGVAAERDLVNQVPSFPRIFDGACLTWLLFSGAATPANSSFTGHIDFGWGQ